MNRNDLLNRIEGDAEALIAFAATLTDLVAVARKYPDDWGEAELAAISYVAGCSKDAIAHSHGSEDALKALMELPVTI